MVCADAWKHNRALQKISVLNFTYHALTKEIMLETNWVTRVL
jgi:hypothetical protein